ncbi:MAG TPA: methylmalonyl-CoA mutase small subunit [Propionibacteriaceae bacterium]|nr:methylmalonyl-CoA mutase small subunit [Propionibacteriaceae bacterium]
MTESPLSLAGDFAQPTREEWESEVLKVLNRRRPPGKELSLDQALARLRTTTVDGLTIEPLYVDTDQPLGYPGVMPFTRGNKVKSGAMTGWDAAALHEDPDVTFTNDEVLRDLANGATSIWLRVDPDAVAPDEVAAALAGVRPELAPVRVSSRTDQDAAALALADFWLASGRADEVMGNLGLDAMSLAVLSGTVPDLSLHRVWVERARQEFPKARALVVDTLALHNAGAGDVDEVAYAIATGVEYLRDLASAGVPAAEAARQILFRLAATDDQFTTIAKFRALRRLWARVLEVLGVPEAQRGAVTHAVTSWRMITRDDPYVNLLRGTIAAFSAAVGDAEILTVLPFDTAHGLPTKASRRFARNTQLVAMEESNIGRVNDPAGGSYYVEQLTDQVALKAWSKFQALERAGGMGVAVATGAVRDQVAATVAERAKRLATRKQPITGVSTFPLQSERDVEVRTRPEAPVPAGLAPHRDSEVFEALRDRAAASRTTVFLACLGERRDFGPREQFTSNLCLVAGLNAPESEGGTPDEIARQVLAADARMVILCSSAKVYAEQAVTVARTLKAAGVETVHIAGRRAETGSPEADDVIDGEVFDGMNVVDFLASTLDLLGAAK